MLTKEVGGMPQNDNLVNYDEAKFTSREHYKAKGKEEHTKHNIMMDIIYNPPVTLNHLRKPVVSLSLFHKYTLNCKIERHVLKQFIDNRNTD
uniref:Uncharacterized protein n=1 Tax=Arion vulgaris TaxID=1028688 RepID=A0A0B7API6_9EUPU